MLGRDVVDALRAPRPRGDRAHPRRARHHRRATSVDAWSARLRARRGRELRRVHRRRRRRVDERDGDARQRHGSGPPRRRGGAGGRARWSTPPPTTSSTGTKDSLRRVRPAAPISAYGRSKVAGETSVAVANSRHLIVRPSGSSARGRELRRDDAADRRRAAGGARRLRSGRLPHLHAATWRRPSPCWPRATSTASTTSPASGACSWFEFAQEIFDQADMETT